MSKSIENVKVATQSEFKDHLLTLSTKSAQIRYLTSKEVSRSDIVKIFLNDLNVVIRYQHVRNIQITPVKKI